MYFQKIVLLYKLKHASSKNVPQKKTPKNTSSKYEVLCCEVDLLSRGWFN